MIGARALLGSLLGTASMAGLVLNSLVLIPVFRLAFVQKKSPIYVISFVNILNDLVNLLLQTFFLTPAILFQTYFFSAHNDDRVPKLLGSIFIFCWYLGSITQTVMAVNRLVVIHYRRTDIFTRRNLIYMFLLIIPLSLFLSILSQYIFPCCAFVYNWKVYSYSYATIADVRNYPNEFIDLPLNTASSVISTVCYATIVYTVWGATKATRGTAFQYNSNSRKNREIAYAIQFAIINIFYTISWITFRVFPILINDLGLQWFIVISMCVTLNSSANALIYLISNKEVMKNLRVSGLFAFKKVATSSNVHQSSDVHSTNHVKPLAKH